MHDDRESEIIVGMCCLFSKLIRNYSCSECQNCEPCEFFISFSNWFHFFPSVLLSLSLSFTLSGFYDINCLFVASRFLFLVAINAVLYPAFYLTKNTRTHTHTSMHGCIQLHASERKQLDSFAIEMFSFAHDFFIV